MKKLNIEHKRNATIDFMRFIFIVCVVLHHAVLFHKPIIAGYIGVEFFFIVSGWLAAEKLSYARQQNVTGESTPDIIINFIIKKIRSFYPELAIATVIGFCLLHFFYWAGKYNLLKDLICCLSDFLLLQIWGFPTYSATGVVWYLSAMISGLLIIAPIAYKHTKYYQYIIAPVLIMLIYGTLASQYDHVGTVMEPTFSGFLHWGLLRAIAGMSLGMCLNKTSNILHTVHFKTYMKHILTLIELIGYTGTIILAYIMKSGSYVDFIMIGLLSISIMISFSNCSNNIIFFLNQKTINKLGLFSLNIFLNHFYVARILANYKNTISSTNLLLIYLSAVFVCSEINYRLSILLRNLLSKLVITDIIPHE